MDASTDWNSWHAGYDDPSSALSERLSVVQRHIREWLDDTAPDPVAVLSACSGDGRDLLDVLAGRLDAPRVTATLIESDPAIAQRARERVTRLGLPGIEVRCADAGSGSAYVDAAPADLVLLCGILGNIVDGDVRRTVAAAPQLCRPGALVIWTRHRRAPDLTPHIRGWFREHGFEEAAFVAPDHALYSVGAHRFLGEPQPLDEGQRLFTFIT